MEYLVKIICVALAASFIILVSGKFGIIENVQLKAPKLISEAFSCGLCLSFWVCLLLSFILFIFVDTSFHTLGLPFMATPITRTLI